MALRKDHAVGIYQEDKGNVSREMALRKVHSAGKYQEEKDRPVCRKISQ
jgi:hypothetical protein